MVLSYTLPTPSRVSHISTPYGHVAVAYMQFCIFSDILSTRESNGMNSGHKRRRRVSSGCGTLLKVGGGHKSYRLEPFLLKGNFLQCKSGNPWRAKLMTWGVHMEIFQSFFIYFFLHNINFVLLPPLTPPKTPKRLAPLAPPRF